MSRPSTRVSGSPTMPHWKWLVFAAVLFAVFLTGALPATAQTCDRNGCGYAACATPATPAPRTLWGELQPVDVGTLPRNRDSTGFNEFQQAYSSVPWYTGVDVANGYLFTSLAYGIQPWDLHAHPENPESLTPLPFSRFPTWINSAEEKWPIQDISVPNDTLAAVAAHAGVGIVIADFSDKSNPHVLYQNHEKDGEEVYTANIGGTNYAFLAASGFGGGVYAFNMDKARQFVSCQETLPTGGTSCPGVYLGRVGTDGGHYVSGVDNYLITAGGDGGFRIWNVANPSSPQLVLSGLFDAPTCGFDRPTVYGVAMWSDGGHYYAAVRTSKYDCAQQKTFNDGRIYDVSCITNGCSGLGSPLFSQHFDSGSSAYFVTFSRSGATPFVYFGSEDRCGGSTQREWLFNVTNPANPHDITPPNGYWGWYYRGGATGFNSVMPRRGKFNGAYFYRAGLSILDIHQRTGGIPPLPDFDWTPNPTYAGAANAVTFNDRSSGSPTSWTWSFSGTAGPSITTSNAQNPVVTFSGPGTVTVTLTTANSVGPAIAPAVKTVTVASPIPAVANVAISPNPAFVCQPVTFTATGVTGQPAPAVSWVLKKGGTTVQPQPPGSLTNTFTWDTTGAAPGNDYTATITATNSAGSASQTSAALTLSALPTLPSAGAFTPTYDGAPTPPAAGTVTYHVNVAGATAWNWDFGDGLGFRGYTTDPVLGPNPASVSYTSTGTKQVRVLIKNCIEAERQSAVLSVSITQTTPLIAAFQPNLFCQFGQCFATQNLPVTYTDNSTGAQFWDYAWDHTGSDAGSCNFTDANHTSPVTSHTFAALGTFQPCLRVRRGASEQNVLVGAAINVSGANPPSINITGPSAGQTGQSLGFSASASNCNPAPTGWSWSMVGGTPNSGTGSAITVTYAIAGTYTITATNSACAGATGVTSTVISSGNGGGGGGGGGSLAAAFSFSPTSPTPGQSVSFDGSASTGSPTQYSWNFGDGQNATGATASHTYANAGTYSVILTITKPGDGAGCFSGICVSDVTHAVVVGGGSLSAAFTFTPPLPNAGQAVTFDASSAAGNPNQYNWDFGDGNNATGKVALHSYASPGTYSVKLTVTAPGSGTNCAGGTCTSDVTKVVPVAAPPLDPSFQSNAQCSSQFGINQCNAKTGDSVSLTATSTQATTYSWDFGDGSTGSGRAVTHTWTNPGSYPVRLTVSNAQTSANQTIAFQITGAATPPPPPPPPKITPVLLPWVAQSRGVLVQTSDLYIHNPGTDPVDVTLEFRKRGTPDVNPPRATLTIQPGQTQFSADVLGNLFNRENLTGFISLSVSKGSSQPIISSFYTVTHDDGTKYAQAVGGVPMLPVPNAAAGEGATTSQFLIGLNDNSDRTAVFGITNPSSEAATYHLSFFDSAGKAIGNPGDLVVSPYGQRQFQIREIRSTFGINGASDYGVKVDGAANSQFFPYDSDLRNGSNDPSYFAAGAARSAKVYLIGALSTPDLSGNIWKTNLVLANTSNQAMPVKLTFTRIGIRSTPERSVTVTLQPGQTQRLANVVSDKWQINDATGVLTIESAGVAGTYPVVQGESYDNSHTNKYGQVMTVFTDSDAAGPGQSHFLVGLRQNADYKSQLWLFNPGTEGGSYDLIYKALDGTVLGQIKNFAVPPGTTRQVRPVDNPIPAQGVTGGFTVQIVVHTGKVLAGAQVVNLDTNDPAYVGGRTAQ